MLGIRSIEVNTSTLSEREQAETEVTQLELVQSQENRTQQGR